LEQPRNFTRNYLANVDWKSISSWKEFFLLRFNPQTWKFNEKNHINSEIKSNKDKISIIFEQICAKQLSIRMMKTEFHLKNIDLRSWDFHSKSRKPWNIIEMKLQEIYQNNITWNIKNCLRSSKIYFSKKTILLILSYKFNLSSLIIQLTKKHRINHIEL
jgi:hypothetical protein